MNGINLINSGVRLAVVKPCAAPVGVAAIAMQIPRDRSWAVVAPRPMAEHPVAAFGEAAAALAGAGTVAARASQRFPVLHRTPPE